VTWTLTNLGKQAVVLKTLSVDWPDYRPATKLNMVSLIHEIWSGNVDNAISICESCWNQGLPSDRTILAEATQTLSMNMSRSLYSGLYGITATFANLTTGGTCTVITQMDYVAP
jgi:hypothetical protein